MPVVLVVLVVLVGMVAGCTPDHPSARQQPGVTADRTSTTLRSTEPTAPDNSGAESVAQRCTGRPGPGHDRRVKVGGSQLAGAELGRGATWAVMLHQTNGDGLCGWWPYASWLSGRGVHVLLVDLCDYGRSTCREHEGSDQAAQAAAAVEWARRHGARRVTLVGASMGGAVALPGAVASGPDAVVDLSGPPTWIDAELLHEAQRLDLPTLLAVSPTDPTFIPAYKRAIRLVPATKKRLVVCPAGHGYEMLGFRDHWNRMGGLVLAWIQGRYVT